VDGGQPIIINEFAEFRVRAAMLSSLLASAFIVVSISIRTTMNNCNAVIPPQSERNPK
jgi:hypothetical protein